jgi:hypothetical protein
MKVNDLVIYKAEKKTVEIVEILENEGTTDYVVLMDGEEWVCMRSELEYLDV